MRRQTCIRISVSLIATLLPLAPTEGKIAAIAGEELTLQTRDVYSLTFYLGLTANAQKFRGVAPFSFVLYRHDPAWGMRSAAARFYELFPESFRKRATYEGYIGYAGVEFIEAKTHRLLCSGSRYGQWTQQVDDASDFGDAYRMLWQWAGKSFTLRMPVDLVLSAPRQ